MNGLIMRFFPESINDVVEVVIDRYAVNEEKGAVERIDRAGLSYDSANSDWVSLLIVGVESVCVQRPCARC